MDDSRRLLELRERLGPAISEGDRMVELRQILKAYGWHLERDNGKARAWELVNGAEALTTSPDGGR